MVDLARIYSSAPTDSLLLYTLELFVPTLDPVRAVADYADHMFGVDGVMHLFRSLPISFALPSKDDSGMQRLAFGFAGIEGDAQHYVDVALAQDETSYIIFREYELSDPTTPASRPRRMPVLGGSFDPEQQLAVFEGGYVNYLDYAWPRERYTPQNAPGLKYL